MIKIEPFSLFAGNFVTFIVSAIVTRFLIYINISAFPVLRSSHQIPTPSAGGLSIILSAFVGTMLYINGFIVEFLGDFKLLIPFGLSTVVLASISFLDDCYPISYRVRLFFHFLAAIVFIKANLILTFPAFPYLEGSIFPQCFTVFVIISLINATNFLDGLNGLLSGCVILNLIVIILMVSLWTVSGFIASVLIASTLGFFIYNFPLGKIFMGDVGSTFLGLALGFLALTVQNCLTDQSSTAWINKTFILSLMPMAFLWFDVGFTLFRRALLGRQLTEAHRDHLFHLLNDAGYSHFFVSGIYFLSVIVMGFLTLACHHNQITFLQLIIIYTIFQIIFCSWVLKKSYAMAR